MARDGEPLDAARPCISCSKLESVERADLLINLTIGFPRARALRANCGNRRRDPECRRLGRERFKAYRDQKLALETHQLSDAPDI